MSAVSKTKVRTPADDKAVDDRAVVLVAERAAEVAGEEPPVVPLEAPAKVAVLATVDGFAAVWSPVEGAAEYEVQWTPSDGWTGDDRLTPERGGGQDSGSRSEIIGPVPGVDEDGMPVAGPPVCEHVAVCPAGTWVVEVRTRGVTSAAASWWGAPQSVEV